MNNNRRALYKGKTEVDLLLEFKERYVENIVYWEIFEDDVLHFTMTLTSPTLQKAFAEYGAKIIGLDAVYKYTDKRIPVWVIVCYTPLGHIVVGYIISTDGETKYLQEALASFLRKTEPNVMIDHDSTECLAVTNLQVKLIN
jgi:hypothetical protein